MINTMKKLLLLIISLSVLSIQAKADVVKPALTEISVNTNGSYSIEIRISIEALLTGINGQFKNTTESPNSDHYDELRELQPNELRERFRLFEDEFKESVVLYLDGKEQKFDISKVDIPLPGYTKVPRTSIIILSGKIDRSVSQLVWYYPNRFGDQAVRVRQVDEKNELWHWSDWQWIKTDVKSDVFNLDEVFTKQSVWQVVKTYTISGFQHILPYGLDHILFIVGLFLFSRQLKPLIWQVTMFTIAHSVTLALAMLGFISLSAQIVEPLIALSIAYIAIENIFLQHLNKHRLAIIFVFGLLHGLGFASVLNDFGMPQEDFVKALISFNVGVEIGQLAIVLAMTLFIAHWIKNDKHYRQFIVIPLSSVIALVALYWTWERFDINALQTLL